MSAAWDDPLGMWLWLAVGQTTLCLGVGLLLGRNLAARPAQAHRRLVAAAAAALLTPLLAAAVGANCWGVLAAPDEPVVYRAVSPRVGELRPPPRTEVLAHAAVQALAVLWALPAGVLLVRIGRGLFRGWRAVRAARAVDAPELSAALRRTAADLGLSHVPRLLDGGRLGPLLWRWSRRPVILVPSAAAGGAGTLGAAGWESVFRHELAHLRRGDPWSALLAEVLVALLWWQPLAWLVRRRLLLAAEFACDDWTELGGADAADYAEALLALAPVCPSAPPGAPAAAAELPLRLQRLLTRDWVASPVLRRGGWAAAALVALLLSGAVALMQAHPPRATTAPSRTGGGVPSLTVRPGR
jgi:beta-lactamase regulating signal transducer with metallopeptidase domain